MNVLATEAIISACSFLIRHGETQKLKSKLTLNRRSETNEFINDTE
jgi:hypothetical protein